jgi:hypothetical protein
MEWSGGTMKGKFVLILAVMALMALPLVANPIPYPNVGTIAPTNTFTASSNGNIVGYFVQGGAASGGGAAFTDYVGMWDITTSTFSGWFFDNQLTTPGTIADFGAVSAGDTLVFVLYDQTLNEIFASDPSMSADKVNHVYATPWGGGTLNGAAIPAGIYLGTEDLPISFPSDFNYNDDSFVFANVTSSQAPEPGSLILLATGLLGGLGAIRKKLLS